MARKAKLTALPVVDVAKMADKIASEELLTLRLFVERRKNIDLEQNAYIAALDAKYGTPAEQLGYNMEAGAIVRKKRDA